jgi:hypothetical protein
LAIAVGFSQTGQISALEVPDGQTADGTPTWLPQWPHFQVFVTCSH